MSNNRSEIARKLSELNEEYDSLDRFFYTNFKIHSIGTNKPFLKAKPNSCYEFSRRLDRIKNHISRLWRLCDSHTGGWFDNDEKRELDKRHRSKLYEIEQCVNKLMSLYSSYDVSEEF